MPDNLLERRRVWYAGRVQGVGFRATTLRIAARHAVTGFVQNLPDGRVLVVVEGEADEIGRFLADVRTTLSRYIRGEDQAAEAPTGEFAAFDVRF